ncbi:unnamed protein product [Paramecium pentaurelia]|uniref:NACHT domain-containing protein n=1 Tax=Paramecium pentaurelia TaxID=43138 RepID=A0A8S1WIU7_9CILI|nr:unnamed protein product [Paramecium pentaurelia]
MDINPGHMNLNLRGGGGCCGFLLNTCIKKDTRRLNNNKNPIIDIIKEEANSLKQLISSQQNSPQMLQKAKESINKLYIENNNLQLNIIRNNSFYQFSAQNEGDIYEILLNCLISLDGFIKISKIKSHQLIYLCLDLFYFIYQIQFRDKNFFLNNQYCDKYSIAIENLKITAQQDYKYEISIIHIAFEKCRKDNKMTFCDSIKGKLFLSFEQFDIVKHFEENKDLLNYNYEQTDISTKDFQLYSFYYVIKWSILKDVQNYYKKTLDEPINILQYTFSQHCSNNYSFILQKYWIQIIFELIAQAKFQPIEDDENSKLVQSKFQKLSEILIEQYLKFYVKLEIKDTNRENLIIDPNYQTIVLIQNYSQTLRDIIEKITLIILKLKNKQNQDLLANLKQEYFEFIYISNQIYQSFLVEIEKIQLVDKIQFNEDIQFKDGIQITIQNYINEIQDSTKWLFQFIIKIEDQIKNPNREMRIDFKKLIAFPQSFYSIIEQLITKKENQYYKQESERYLQQQSLQINKELEKYEIPIQSAISILSMRFNDSILNDNDFSQIDNDKNLSGELTSLDDLQKLQMNCLKCDLILKYKRKHKTNQKNKFAQCSNQLEKINLNDSQYLMDILQAEYKTLEVIFLKKNNIEKVKELFEEFQALIQKNQISISHKQIVDDQKTRLKEFYRQVSEKVQQIIHSQVIIYSFDQLKPDLDELKNLYLDILQKQSIEDLKIKVEDTLNSKILKSFKENLNSQQQEISTTIKNYNNQISSLSNLMQKVNNHIYNFKHIDNQDQKNKYLKEASLDIKNYIQNQKLNKLRENEQMMEIPNSNKQKLDNFVENITLDQLNKIDLINYIQPQKKKLNQIGQPGIHNINLKKKGIISEINQIINQNYILTSQEIINNNNLSALEYMSNKFLINQVLQKNPVSQELLNNKQPDWIQAVKDLTKKNHIATLKGLLKDIKQLIADVNRNDRQGKELFEELNTFVDVMQNKRNQNVNQQQNVEIQMTQYKDCILKYKQEEQNKQYHLDNCQFKINPIYVEQRFKIKKFDQNRKIQQEFLFTNQQRNFDHECLSELTEFIQNTNGWSEVFLLFGPQGSGKSRELRILQNKLWQEYNQSKWIPIFVSFSQNSNLEHVFLKKLNGIFKDKNLLRQFQSAVNSKVEKVLFLIDDIDEVQIDKLKQNLIKLNFKHLGFTENLIGKTVKFIVSARSQLKDYYDYQLYFAYTNINTIIEIELLPFNDEQRLKYFQLNHQIRIKKVLFNYYIKYNKNKDINEFENIWKPLELDTQKLINEQEKNQVDYPRDSIPIYQDFQQAIIQSHLIENIKFDQYDKIAKDISKLRSSRNYLNIIQNHHFQHLTQSPFQLEIFILLFSKLRKQHKDLYFKEQIKQQYSKLQQKYPQSSKQTQNFSTSSLSNLISLKPINVEENLQKIIVQLEKQNFFSQYKYFNILRGDNRGIQMNSNVYTIKANSIIVIEALRANNLTMFQILQIYVASFNKKYTKKLENEIESYEFDSVFSKVEKFCEQLALQMTFNNLTQIEFDQQNLNADDIDQQQFLDEKIYINPFLINKQGNKYIFKYKMIQEYYFAKFILKFFTNEVDINEISQSELNKENVNLTFSNFAGALNIVRDHLRKQEKIREKLVQIIKMSKNSQYIRISSNLIYLMSYLDFNLEGEDLQNIQLSDTNISGISFFNCNLSKSKFTNVIINRCNFDFAQLNDVQWSNIQITKIANLDHEENVEQVIFSPDGKQLISLSAFWLKIWDFKSFDLIEKIENLDKNNHFLSFAISNKQSSNYYIATCSQNEVVLREFSNLNNILFQQLIDFPPAGPLQFSPDRKIMGFIDTYGWLRYWDNDLRQPLQPKYIGVEKIIENSPQLFYQINQIAFDSTNSYFLFKGQNTLTLYELLSEKIEQIKQITGTQFIVSSDGKSLAVAIKDEVSFYEWKDDNFNETLKIQFQNQILQILTLNSNQQIGLQFNDDLALWCIKDKCFKRIFKGFQNINNFCLNPQNNVIAQWTDTKKTIILWNMNQINPNQYYQIFDSEVLKAEFSPNGQLIILQLQSKIIFWDCWSDELINILDEQSLYSFSQNGNYLVTQSFKDGIILWDSSNIYELQQKAKIIDIYSIKKFFFLNNNNLETLAIISNDGELLKIWELKLILDQQQMINTNSEFDNIICIAVSPTDLNFAFVGDRQNNVIKISDREKWNINRELTGHNNKIIQIEYSGNGQLLASRSQDHYIRIWFVKESGANSIKLPIKYNPNLLDSQHICIWIPNTEQILASNEGDQIILWSILYSSYVKVLETQIQQPQQSMNINLQFEVYEKSQLFADECKDQECLQVSFSPNGKFIAALYFALNNQGFLNVLQNNLIEINPRIVIWNWQNKTVVQSFLIFSWQRFNFDNNSSSIITLDYDIENQTNILKFNPINQDVDPKQIQIGFQNHFSYLLFSPKSDLFLAVREEQNFINHFFLFKFQDQEQPTILDYFQLTYGLPVTFSPDGNFLVYPGRQTIEFKKIYNTNFPTKIRPLKSQYNWSQIKSFQFKYDQILFGFCETKNKFIISKNLETVEYNNEILEFDIRSVSFYDNMIACGGKSGSEIGEVQNKQGIVKIIDISNLDDLKQVQQIESLVSIMYVFFSHNGKYLLVQEQDYKITLFQQKDQQYQGVYLINLTIDISSVCFSSNENDFIILSNGGQVFFYNFTISLLSQQKDTNNTLSFLYRLKTIPKKYEIQAINCLINNSQITTEFNNLQHLFKYYGANQQT